MANGPMGEAEAKQIEQAAVWRSLPDEMEAGLAKLEAEHPGEVLSAVSGGAIEAVPEGRELTDWMSELARAGGFGDTDASARRFDVETSWLEPVRPEALTAFLVGFEVACSSDPIGAYEVQVTLSTMERDVVHIASETFTDQTQGYVRVPGGAAGSYIVSGSVNNAGVDRGSEPNEHGYRASFSFSCQVGEYSEGGGLSELAVQLGTLSTQLMGTTDTRDFVELVMAICTDLAAAEALSDSLGAIANARESPVLGIKRTGRLNGSAVAEAGNALLGIANNLPALQYNPDDPDDPATRGIVSAYIDQFSTRVQEAFPEE